MQTHSILKSWRAAFLHMFVADSGSPRQERRYIRARFLRANLAPHTPQRRNAIQCPKLKTEC